MKICILGCGNLGQAIARGLLNKKVVAPQNLSLIKRKSGALEAFKQQGVQTQERAADACLSSDIIIACLKPYNTLNVIQDLGLSPEQWKGKTVVSCATGIDLSTLNTVAPEAFWARAMPNTAAGVSESITALTFGAGVPEQLQKEVDSLFQSIGTTITIEENLIDAATVLGACGIAFVMRFIRSLVQGGIEIGFNAKDASSIAQQTVVGAAQLLIQNGLHPEAEIDKVTTPQGCTIAGLNQMEHAGFSSALIQGINTSFQKIKNQN